MSAPQDVWRMHREGWSVPDIASYLDLAPSRVQRCLARKNPPPIDDEPMPSQGRTYDMGSPYDISEWESRMEGGVVRWRRPQ